MHTFKKETDGTYAVGQWLVGLLEYKFMPIFYVSDRQNAIAAINALNGADLTAAPLYPDFHVLREAEPKKRSGKGAWIWTSVLLGAAIGAMVTCSRAKATVLWPEPPPTQAINPPQPTLPKAFHGDWCRGEGSYLRNISSCPPPDRIIITSRTVLFHEHTCMVRSAVPARATHHRLPLQYHVSFWCRPTGQPPADNPHVPHPLATTVFYWLGAWDTTRHLFMNETDSTFEPKDSLRFLREHPND